MKAAQPEASLSGKRLYEQPGEVSVGVGRMVVERGNGGMGKGMCGYSGCACHTHTVRHKFSNKMAEVIFFISAYALAMHAHEYTRDCCCEGCPKEL